MNILKKYKNNILKLFLFNYIIIFKKMCKNLKKKFIKNQRNHKGLHKKTQQSF